MEKNREKAWCDLSRDVCRCDVTVKQEVNYDLTLSTYIIRNAWRMQLAESRTTERRRKGQCEKTKAEHSGAV